MRAEDQFHVGIVVDDLDATLARLSDLFGYVWCEQFHHLGYWSDDVARDRAPADPGAVLVDGKTPS